MKNLVMVSVVAFGVLVVAASCGPTSLCSPTTCLGCCDARGECHPGSSAMACGLSGGSCQQCVLGGGCINGQCGTFGGGNGATGGGGGGGGATSSDGGADGGSDAGLADAGRPTFRAYTVVTAATAMLPSCFRNGVGPANPTFPATTFEVLVWESSGVQYISLAELPAVTLGDSPTIRLPNAIEGADGDLAWVRNEQRPISNLYTELRQTQASFKFTDLTAPSTTGTLELAGQYVCMSGSQACPTGASLPPDGVSCLVDVPFVAQVVPVTAKWTTPSATVVQGARKYLVAMDETPLRNVAAPSCFRNQTFPAGRGVLFERNARALDVWQVFNVGATSYLRTSQNTWVLGDAPTISVSADLPADGGVYQQLSTQQTGTSPVETRTTRVAISVLDVPSAQGTIELQASYACSGANCPVGSQAPADAASCSASATIIAAELP